MSIKHFQSAQRGAGMVEVLVAMLLLAVGVLGFSVLQVRAISATNEASNRSQAMLILRGLSESVRANSVGQYLGVYPGLVSALNVSTAPTAPKSCVASACTPTQFAAWDAYQAAAAAYKLGMRINMTSCPGAQTYTITNTATGGTSTTSTPPARQCLLAGWGTTTPTIGTGTADCISSTGSYNSAATCLVMEAY